MRKPGTSFADKNNVQRLAGDALQGMQHVTTFNLQVNVAPCCSLVNLVGACCSSVWCACSK
jgi:hypothetical protein